MKVMARCVRIVLVLFFSTNAYAETPSITGSTKLLPPFQGLACDVSYYRHDSRGAVVIAPNHELKTPNAVRVENALVTASYALVPAAGAYSYAVNMRVPVQISRPGRYRIRLKYRNSACLYSAGEDVFISTSGYMATHNIHAQLYYRGEPVKCKGGTSTLFWDIDKATLWKGLGGAVWDGVKEIPAVYAAVATGGTTKVLAGVKAAVLISSLMEVMDLVDTIRPDAESNPEVQRVVEIEGWLGVEAQDYDLALLIQNSLGLGAVGSVLCVEVLIASATITLDEIDIALLETNDCTVIASSDSNGSIDPAGQMFIGQGGNIGFHAIPNGGYRVSKWTVDGQEVVERRGHRDLLMTDIRKNTNVEVTFSPTSSTDFGLVEGTWFNSGYTIAQGSSDRFQFTIGANATSDHHLTLYQYNAATQSNNLGLVIGQIDSTGKLIPPRNRFWWQVGAWRWDREEQVSLEGFRAGTYDVVVFGGSALSDDIWDSKTPLVPPPNSNHDFRGGVETGPYGLFFRAPMFDAYEPDDTPELASLIRPDGSLQHHSLSGGNIDWARFQLHHLSEVAITTDVVLGDHSTNELGLRVSLFGPDTADTEIATHYDANGNAMIRRLGNGSLEPGVYYVKIESDTENDIRHYTIAVSAITIVPPYQSISGYVLTPEGLPLADVTVWAENFSIMTTGSDGYYSVDVPYNWSGRVTASKAGNVFSPAHRDYVAVNCDKMNQDYASVFACEAGSGTEEDPFQVGSEASFQRLSAAQGEWDKHFVLTADLDLEGASLTPIGTWESPFTGVFNGNGRVIRNAVIDLPEESHLGLFRYVGGGGRICDIGVEGVFIAGYEAIGGLVGINQGTISRCYATGHVEGNQVIGGLVGWNSGTITACYSTAFIGGTHYDAGGLAGANDGAISNSFAAGTVHGNDGVGGLIGTNWATITNCYANGDVSGETTIGGLAGRNSGRIANCYASGAVGESAGGGLVGHGFAGTTASFWDIDASERSGSAGGKGLTGEQMRTAHIFQNAGWAGNGWVMADGQDYPRLAWEDSDGAPIPTAEPVPLVGDGSEVDPYQVWTADDFALLSWHVSVLDKHIALMADLNMSGVALHPLGDLGPFTGVFEGNSHVIRDAVIDLPQSDFVGLFSSLGEDGQIRNLSVEGETVSGRWEVGGLAGHSAGMISSCHTMGTVTGNSSVGGLVGKNMNTTVGGGTISASHSAAIVSGSGYSGGLVGLNFGVITASHATGDVTSDGSIIGGLVGANSGRISNCHATGVVTGFWAVGGLVGDMVCLLDSWHIEWGHEQDKDNIAISNSYATGRVTGNRAAGGLLGDLEDGTISNCYATGDVSGGGDIGGLVGEHVSAGTITNCYAIGTVTSYPGLNIGGLVASGDGTTTASFWDTQTSGQTASAGGEGKTTAQMKAQATFADAGWDFVETWRMPEGDYPRLAWQAVNDPPQVPSGISPPDGATGIGLTPTLQSSAFSDPNPNDAHAASRWRIATNRIVWSDGTTTIPEGSVIWQSGDTTSEKTSIIVPADILSYGTTYYWQVQHQDNSGAANAWSEWSAPVSFTTAPETVTTHTLSVSAVPAGAGTVSGGGTYNHGQAVSLLATPAAGYRVKAWTGTDDDSSTANNNTVTMTSDKSVTVQFEAIPPATLSISMAGSAEPVAADDQVNYTITYGNTGELNATNTVITEILPAGVSFVSASGGGVYNASARTITWTIGTLAGKTAGQTVSFVAKVDSSMAEGGTIRHGQLTIRGDQTGPATAAAVTTTVRDTQPPQVSGQSPADGADMVPCGGIIRLRITDGGSGVRYDGGTVTIRIAGDLIYDGAHETSAGVYDTRARDQAVRGVCRRSGSAADYEFTFTPTTRFDYEQPVDVVVMASDVAGNTNTVSYSFITQTRSFGKNAKVNSDTAKVPHDNPATAVDSAGNIWVVWDQQAAAGNTDIYIGKLAAGGSAFGASSAVYQGPGLQSHPVIAVDRSNRLYVAWQSQAANGKWDVYVSRSSNGTTWTEPLVVNVGDPNNTSNQRYPAMAADSREPGMIYVAYEDDRGGNRNIWMATSTNGTVWTETPITSHSANQTQPDVFIDPNDSTAYVLWTDARTAATQGTNIYAASSANAWANVAAVASTSNETRAAGAAFDTLYLAWVSDTGTLANVRYGNDAGGLPVTGTGIADESGVIQASPSLTLPRDARGTKLFAAWQDSRDVRNNNDTDIYFAEGRSAFGTNILVNDDTGTSAQSAPVVGIDGKGDPYVVWVDERNGNRDIYYAGAVSIDDPMATTIVTTGTTVTVKATTQVNLQITIPQMPSGIQADEITICEVISPPRMPSGMNEVGLKYEFGPSGLQFATPVTIRIPLPQDGGYSAYRIYRYDPDDLTSPSFPWTERGIHNPAVRVTGINGTYLEVQVDHFSIYGAAGITAPPSGGGGGGGGGGCALAPYDGGCGPMEFALPFVMYVLVLLGMTAIRKRRYTG